MEPGIEKSNPSFVSDVKTILEQARKSSYQSVNTAMVQAYWLVGKRIVQEEQDGKERAVYGGNVLKLLSKAISSDFGDGLSIANLKNFRQFYLTYPDYEISYAVRSLLTWTHHRLIMRVQNPNICLTFPLNKS